MKWALTSETALIDRNDGVQILEARGGVWEEELHPYGARGYELPLFPSLISADVMRSLPDRKMLEPGASAWTSLPAAARAAAGPEFQPFFLEERAIVDGQGRIMGWYWGADGRLKVFQRGGQVDALPEYLLRQAPLLTVPLVLPTARADGEGFYLWLGSSEQRGALIYYGPSGPVRLAVPTNASGPLSPVFTPSASQAVGYYSPDDFYRLEGRKSVGDRLSRSIRAVRRDHPNLELRKLVLSEGQDFAVLTFADVEGGSELYWLDLKSGRGRSIWHSPAEDGAGVRPGVASWPVTVPSPNGALPARLYRDRHTARPRGVIVTFHGGPPVNTTLNYHVTTRRYLALGFDVLDVDYRGSPGYGEAQFRALHDDPGGIQVQDLRAAVTWARAQRRYRGRVVGASGNSFGGLAIAVATQQPIEGLDFGVSDSGLIEMTPQYRQRMCSDNRYDWIYVFGQVGQGPGCELKPTGATGWRRFSPLPVFLLVGGKDLLVSNDIARDWAAAANAGGGCASLFRNAEGGHGIDGWQGDGRSAAEAALADWIDAVVQRMPGQCGRRWDWPALPQPGPAG